MNQNLKILIVEDEITILKMVKLILERLGYHVCTANSPIEAVDLVKTKTMSIDVLITDMMMPEMNGKELAKKFQNFYPGIKILFMSGYSSDAIAYAGEFDNNMGFIKKPFTKTDLDIAIKDLLKS